ncbi:endonuclease domain-containing protein [Streptosporangium vulgare]|uniref:Endonuclease domain-containing protein n=1 Tax=Streptosporangium vulgare TaxID=46190 RepID=A0ABV5TPY5_9ACTN
MFAPRKTNLRDGREVHCRVCQRIVTRIRRLGLRPEVAATPLAEDGRCEVCGAQPPNWGLQLDHDHTTGDFRGWLCGGCNAAIGHAGDNPIRLRALADYLDKKAR